MTPMVLTLLAVALGLGWWVARRATALRREAELREVRALEALVAARQAAGGGANIDVAGIFGATPAAGAAVADDMALPAEVAAMLGAASAQRASVHATTPAPEWRSNRADAGPATSPVAAAPDDSADAAAGSPESPAAVRDLVQALYEARGFRAEPADPSARPVETVLLHGSDPGRAYAFAPLAEPPAEAALRSILDRARGIGQKRLLIPVEHPLRPGVDTELPAHGVRVLDRAAIETQLARLDAATAEKVRAKACERACRRLTSA